MVVVVAHAVADGDEVDALLAGLRDLVGEHGRVGDADVGDAVGGEHDDVQRVRAERLAGLLVAEQQPGLHVRAAARAELVDGVDDALGVGDRRRREHRSGVVAVGDDGDGVVVAQRARRAGPATT